MKVTVDNDVFDVNVEEIGKDKLRVSFNGELHEVLVEDAKEAKENGNGDLIKAPMPGVVSTVLVKVGDEVNSGDAVVSLLAMKMENQITAPKKGKVKEIKVKPQQTVDAGDVLIVLE